MWHQKLPTSLRIVMEEAFWFNSWELKNNHTGFRRQDIHPYAVKYLPPFSLEGKSVFVPLCGKSLDLLYFSQFALRVVGVEIVEKTIVQFFEENQRTYKRIGNRFVSGNITIFYGDFFSLTPDALGQIDVVYDRASLATLPQSLRMKYRRVLEQLTPIGALNFLSIHEYAPNEVAYYYQNYVIDHVERPTIGNHDSTRTRSLPTEHAFLMHKLYDTSVFSTAEELV